MKELILKVDDEIYDKIMFLFSLFPPDKLQVQEKKKSYRKYYGILEVKNSQKEIDKELRKIRDEWEKRLSL
jgi:hypothetical protein